MGDIMNTLAKPAMRPARPQFSSGPTVKHPGWSLSNLQGAVLGRSHRSKTGKGRLKEAIDRTREVLQVPDDFLIGIVPASDTGAVEMAMWSMLGRCRSRCWPGRASQRTGWSTLSTS
jgi:phosphoserine aminotransferase